MRLHRCFVAVNLVVVTILATYVVVGHDIDSGRVLFTISSGHGLHLSDVPVLGLWLVAVVSSLALWGHGSSPGPHRPE